MDSIVETSETYYNVTLMRNSCKGHMDKTTGVGQKQGREEGLAGSVGSGRG